MKVGTDGVLLGAWPDVKVNDKILDIGTGTGLIALMLAQKDTSTNIVGVEIDKETAKQAIENVDNSPLADRVQIEALDVQTFSRLQAASYDLIVSNPPVFTGGVLSENMKRRQVRHTVKLSHSDLLRSVLLLLKPNGRFCVILPWLEGLRFQEWAANYQLFVTKKCIISPRPNQPPNRLLLQFERKESNVIVSEMSIYAKSKGNERSDTFKQMTGDYYLD